MKPALPFLTLGALVPWMCGCIAWEIRDGIRETNQHLCEVKPALVHTLHSVEESNRRIEQTDAQLADLHAAMLEIRGRLTAVQETLRQTDEHLSAVGGTLGQTNPMLTDLDGGLERMRILNEVHATLTDVNKALGPLNRAMSSLGGAMSFLGMGGDSATDLLSGEPQAGGTGGGGESDEARAAAPGAEAEVVEPAGGSAASAGATGSKRPDPLLGTWVLVYPEATAGGVSGGTGAAGAGQSGGGQGAAAGGGRITVFTADGKFLTAQDGQPPRTGTWSRQGRTLTLTFVAPAAGATAPSAGAGAPGAGAETEVGELLTLNSRSLTVRKGDQVRVYARP